MQLEIKNLTGSYGRRTVLHAVNLTLHPGVYGLLGPNGSGKTTLLRLITGLLEAPDGSVLFDGRPRSAWKNREPMIGYLPQKFGLLKELSVYQQMLYFACLKQLPAESRKQEIETAIQSVSLTDRIRERCGRLSGGMIRRLGIAQAILGQPDLILFDEPTAGLDPEERLRFKSVLNLLGHRCPVVLATHIVEDVESACDQVIVLSNGRFCFDGSRAGLARLAAGRVYELPADQLDQIKLDKTVISYFDDPAWGKQVRILLTGTGGSVPDPDSIPRAARRCEPGAADGYLYAVKRLAD